MKSILNSLLLSTIITLTAWAPVVAQSYPEPTSAAYKALVKEYVAAFQTGDLTKLKAALPAVEKAHPGHPNTLYFQAFYTEASGGDLTAAMKGYSDVIRLKPDFTEAYQHRAVLFYKKGMDDRAVADMNKAIETAGKDVYPAMYGDRGKFKYGAGDYPGAFADYKQATEMDPANAKWYRGAANTAIDMKNPVAAEALFNAALSGGQRSNGAIRAAFGNLLMRELKFAEADAQCKLALSASGFSPDAKDLNIAGIVAMKVRDYPRAIGLLERAMAADPRDVDFVNNRASVAIEQKAWEDVYTYAQKALAINPNNPLANGLMAVGISRTNRGEALADEYLKKGQRLEAAGK